MAENFTFPFPGGNRNPRRVISAERSNLRMHRPAARARDNNAPKLRDRSRKFRLLLSYEDYTFSRELAASTVRQVVAGSTGNRISPALVSSNYICGSLFAVFRRRCNGCGLYRRGLDATRTVSRNSACTITRALMIGMESSELCFTLESHVLSDHCRSSIIISLEFNNEYPE